MPDKNLQYPFSGNAIDQSGNSVNLVDPIGGIRVFNEHQASIHDGNAYTYSAYGTILAGASLVMIGRVKAKQVHFDGFSVHLSQGDTLLEFFESPAISAVGTQQNARRKNRAINNTATMLVYSGSTVTSDGTLILVSKPPLTGGGAHIESAIDTIGEGWVLKENTDYMIRLTNQAASTTSYSVEFNWHESETILS